MQADCLQQRGLSRIVLPGDKIDARERLVPGTERQVPEASEILDSHGLKHRPTSFSRASFNPSLPTGRSRRPPVLAHLERRAHILPFEDPLEVIPRSGPPEEPLTDVEFFRRWKVGHSTTPAAPAAPAATPFPS